MNKVSKLMYAITAALAAQTAVASNIYVGAKIGSGWLDSACAISSNCDDDAIGAGIYTGYQFSDFFGLELSSDYLGDYDTNFSSQGFNAQYSDPIMAVSLSPKLTIPTQSDISLFVKAGPAFISHAGEDDVVIAAGIGGEKFLSDNFALRLEYQYFNDFNDKYINNLNANFLSVGLSYFFGNAAQAAPVAAQAPVEPAPVTEPVAEVPPEPEVVMAKTKTQKEAYTKGLFETNGTALSSEGEQELQSSLDTLLAHPQATIEIVGHTDSSGSEKYNMTLSKKRADAVAAYFIENGVEANRITSRGEGESNPVASNTTAEGRSLNRRVETTIPSFEYEEASQ
ncbi:OmpA family protein [Vibrio sp. T187]|uniref:OmpA family protein n=1 Tax=Vibrio TaxID=662 RepID=UPI0010C94C09|nr:MULTISPECIES: OmpA family protein [Vibrio]MBW3695595.1 OmpA family protein [Vibrio sp. T187]